MRKSLVSVGFGLILLIVGSFISNLIIKINKSEPTYNNNSLTSVYIKVVKNNSNKIEIERKKTETKVLRREKDLIRVKR